jgi:hypothetical protein
MKATAEDRAARALGLSATDASDMARPIAALARTSLSRVTIGLPGSDSRCRPLAAHESGVAATRLGQVVKKFSRRRRGVPLETEIEDAG